MKTNTLTKFIGVLALAAVSSSFASVAEAGSCTSAFRSWGSGKYFQGCYNRWGYVIAHAEGEGFNQYVDPNAQIPWLIAQIAKVRLGSGTSATIRGYYWDKSVMPCSATDTTTGSGWIGTGSGCMGAEYFKVSVNY